MKHQPITVSAYDLKVGLKALKPIVCQRGGVLPVLTGVLVTPGRGWLRLEATDLEVGASFVIYDDRVKQAGPPFVVQLARLAPIVAPQRKPSKTIEDSTISMTVDGDEIELAYGGRTDVIRLLPVDEWPKAEDNIPGGTTMDMRPWHRVLPFASDDDARPILTGICWSGNSLAATDSYRLGVEEIDVEREDELIVRSRAIALTRGWTEAQVYANDQLVIFASTTRGTGMGYVRSRRIQGQFPNYHGLMPETADGRPTVTIDDVKRTVGALRQLDGFGEINTPVRIEPGPEDSFRLHMIVQDVGTSTHILPGMNELPDGLVPAYNPAYLASLLDGMPDGTQLALLDGQKPTLLYRQTTRRLIMPVRVS